MYKTLDGQWPLESQAKDERSSQETSDAKESDASCDSFSEILRCHFRRSELSITHLAQRSWLDIGYISRLLNQDCDPLNPSAGAGGKRPRQPNRDTVIRLGVGLRLPLHDIDDLLMAAGYAPLVRSSPPNFFSPLPQRPFPSCQCGLRFCPCGCSSLDASLRAHP